MTDLLPTDLAAAERHVGDRVLEGRFDEFMPDGPAVGSNPQMLMECVDDLLAWLGQNRPSRFDEWPSFNESLNVTDYFRRAALIRELAMERPSLFTTGERAVRAFGSREVVSALPEPTLVRDMLNSSPYRVLNASRRKRTPRDVNLLRHVAVLYAVQQADRYHIFQTSKDNLRNIAHELDDIAAFIGEIKRDGQPMLAAMSLVDYLRGRIARAQGGRSFRVAEQFLTSSLDADEERTETKLRANDDRAAHYRNMGAFRAARTLLQLSYLNYCRGRFEPALRQIRQARLFAFFIANRFLVQEIDLVKLSIRRARIRPSMLAKANAAAVHEMKSIESGFVALEKECADEGRQVYSTMATYQLGLCHLYEIRGGDADDGKAAMDVAAYIERMSTASPDDGRPRGHLKMADDMYWRASAIILRLFVYLHKARKQSDPTKRKKMLDDAMKAADDAERLIGGKDFENLRVQLEALMAEIATLRRNPSDAERAERHLRNAEDMLHHDPDLGGFAATDPAAAMCALIRIELDTANGNFHAAASGMRHFESTYYPHAMTAWLHDRYAELKETGPFFVITDEYVHAAAGRLPGDSTLGWLEAELKRYLMLAAERKLGNTNRAEIAKLYNISPTTVKNIRDDIADPQRRVEDESNRRKRGKRQDS